VKYTISLTVNLAVPYVIPFLLQHTVIVILIISKSDVQLIVVFKKNPDNTVQQYQSMKEIYDCFAKASRMAHSNNKEKGE